MQVRLVHMKPLSKDIVPVHIELFSALWHGIEGATYEGHSSTFCSVPNPINRRDPPDYFIQVYVCSFSGAVLILCDGCFVHFFSDVGKFLLFLNLYLPDMNRCQREVLDLVYT